MDGDGVFYFWMDASMDGWMAGRRVRVLGWHGLDWEEGCCV